MKRYMPVMIAAVLFAMSGLFVAHGLPLLETILADIWDTTNHEIRVQVSNGFLTQPYTNVDAASYTVASTSKSNVFLVDYTDTGAAGVTLSTALTEEYGRTVTIKDVGLNAGTNNITIGTEGSETIDEAAAYTMNANGEAVTLISDGSNWLVTGGYAE